MKLGVDVLPKFNRDTTDRNRTNCAFSYGVSPGDNRFTPLSVARDQLLCFPLPFTPANGFSHL